MVGYIAQPTIVEEEEQDQDSKSTNPIYPLDPLDPSSPEFAFVNSLLDLDFINDFLEDTSELVRVSSDKMADASDSIVKAEPLELEKEGNVGNSSADCVNPVTVKSEIEDDGMLMKMVNDLGDCLVASFSETAGKGADNSGDGSSDSESGEESSSSSSSSSCDSDSSDDSEEVKEEQVKGKLKVEVEEGEIEEGEIRDGNIEEMGSDSDVEFGGIDEEEEGVGVVQGPIKSKNELQVLPPVPPVDAKLQPHHQMLPVGVVLSTLGAQVIVEGTEKHTPLNEGSILWITEKRSPLGLVDEIFGPVQNPYYVVRYNSETEVPAEIHQGTTVSFVPEFAQHVLNDNLYKKGYDASGENDEELTDEAEFSDDEKEAEYRKIRRMSKRGMNHQTNDSKRKNRNKNKNKNRNGDGDGKGNWNSNNMPTNGGQQPSNHNQHNGSAGATGSANNGTELTNGVGLFPPFPQMVQPSGNFQPPNAGWFNAMAPQQANGAFVPGGFPANNMPWPVQNQPFHNPFNLGQGPLPNGGQMNPFVAMAGSLLGGMGFQMQPNFPIMNIGGQGMMPNQLQVQPDCNFQPQVQPNCNFQPQVQPDCNFQPQVQPNCNFQSQAQPNCNLQPPGDSQAPRPQQFNFGASSSRGRKPFRRGGGRFSGGRGGRGL